MRTLVGLLAAGALVAGSATLAPRFINRPVQTLSYQTESHQTESSHDVSNERRSPSKVRNKLLERMQGEWIQYSLTGKKVADFNIRPGEYKICDGVKEVGKIEGRQYFLQEGYGDKKIFYRILDVSQIDSEAGIVKLIDERMANITNEEEASSLREYIQRVSSGLNHGIVFSGENLLHMGEYTLFKPNTKVETNSKIPGTLAGRWAIDNPDTNFPSMINVSTDGIFLTIGNQSIRANNQVGNISGYSIINAPLQHSQNGLSPLIDYFSLENFNFPILFSVNQGASGKRIKVASSSGIKTYTKQE